MKLKALLRSSVTRRALSLLVPAMSLTTVCQAAAQEPAPPSTPPAPTPGSWSTAPTSSSGSDLGTQPTQPTGTAPAASGDVEARVKALEAKLAGMQEKEEKRSKVLEWLEHVKISGYVQPQLIWQSFNEAASPDVGAGGASGLPPGIGSNTIITRPDGTTTNPDFFRLRRARLKVELLPTEYAKVVIEIDPNLSGGTAAGTGTIARNVEAVGIIPWSKDVKTEVGMGIFKIPFGYEVLQSDADRPFIERSWSEQNLVPGEFDTGVRVYTTALDKKLAVQAAVVNGTTQGERNFTVLPDMNRGKDVVGRAAYNFGPFDAGVSGIVGQDSVVDATALKFKQYTRWGVNFEAAVHHKFVKALGNTKVFAELTLAQNLDRGVRYSFALPTIPSNINDDAGSHDERGLFVRLEQDFSEWFTLGLRYDMYTPDSAQKNNARDTYSAVGAVHFTKGLQLMLEFDHAIDNVHAPGKNAPSKNIETFSSVLQARF